jgi:hypothetical protein
MTDLATTEAIIPEGYDPNGPDASRENYARALAAEARGLYREVERFYVLFATIRDQRLFQLLGYSTIQEFALKEYNVSPATAQRWIVTGRAIAEIEPVPKGLLPTNPNLPPRISDEARISQREAARLARIKREEEEAEAQRAAREAREEARKAKREAAERERAEVEAAEPEVLVARPMKSHSRQPERMQRVSARDTLNRLMGIIEAVDDARTVANAATSTEKAIITAFAAHFAPRRAGSQEVMSEKDCAPHPVGRKLGKDCGRCGAKGVWK